MKFGITGSKLRKKLLSSLAILSLSFTGLVALSTPASASGQETITFDPAQYVTDNGAAGFFKVIAESAGVSGYGHAEWAPWATGSALNADPTLVDWMTAGVPWNHGWKVKTDVGNANNVLYIQKPQSSELNSGITLLDRTDNQTIISTGNMVVSAKVKALADASVTVTMKLTDTNGGAVTQSATTSGTANTWSTLTFDFTTPASGTFDSALAYKKLDLMFDPANAKAGQGHEDWGNNPVTSATTSKLYFLDDVSYTLAAAPGGGGSPAVPVAHRLVAAGSTGLIGTPFDKGYKDWFQYYSAGVKYYTALAEVGTAVTLKWHVTNTSGAAFADQAVNLIVGKSYSISTASFSTTYSGHASFNTTGHGTNDAQTIPGTTDANGDVSWTLTNTDVVGQDRPENLNADVPDGGVFAQIALLLPGGSQGAEDQDIIDLHFVAPAEDEPAGQETITFDPAQYVTDNGAAGFFKVIAESAGVSGYGHAEWAPWATGSALNADPTLVDWMTAGVPWNHGWKVKTDVGNANNVLYIQKPQSSELNSGITLLDRTDNQTIISTGNMVVSAKVKALADASVTVTMKLTDTNGGAVTQSATTSGTANTWSTLTFDFTTPASGTFDSALAYKKLDLMFDPANAKAGQGHEDWGNNPVTSATTSKLYFLDDVSYTLAAAPGGGGSPAVPVAHRLVAAGSTGLIGTPFDKGYKDWFQYYSAGVKYYTALAEVGTAVTLKWHVTNTSGAAFADQAVNLIVGKSYSISTASFSTTYSGHASFNTTGHGTNDAQTIPGTTDANGDVSWTLTNTDVVGQDRPENLNADVPDGGVFAQIALLLPGGSQGAEDQDIIDLHFVKAADYVAPPYVIAKSKMISTPTLSYDLGAKTLTCSNLTADGKISDAAYFLFINNKMIGGKVAGTTKGLNYGYPGVTLSTSGATLDSATWTIAASWNTNNIARARCLVKSFVTNAETIVAATSTVSIPRIGKYMPRAKKGATVATTAVTMRLVEPALVKDAAGKASNYFDWSYNALENDWAKYYGPKLAFIYKYINAGSTTTFKWHVTDTNTGESLASFPVSLIVNKNYGGVENATFTYEMNGATKEIAASPSNSGTGETKIAGMTDENGNVSFTITNTNSVASAEPTPAALNEMQPASAVNLHSQITLTAGLDQTKESIDLLEIHIVKP